MTLPDADVSVVAAAGPNIPGGDAFENRSVPLDMNSTTGAVHTTGEAIHIRDIHELPSTDSPIHAPASWVHGHCSCSRWAARAR